MSAASLLVDAGPIEGDVMQAPIRASLGRWEKAGDGVERPTHPIALRTAPPCLPGQRAGGCLAGTPTTEKTLACRGLGRRCAERGSCGWPREKSDCQGSLQSQHHLLHSQKWSTTRPTFRLQIRRRVALLGFTKLFVGAVDTHGRFSACPGTFVRRMGPSEGRMPRTGHRRTAS